MRAKAAPLVCTSVVSAPQHKMQCRRTVNCTFAFASQRRGAVTKMHPPWRDNALVALAAWSWNYYSCWAYAFSAIQSSRSSRWRRWVAPNLSNRRDPLLQYRDVRLCLCYGQFFKTVRNLTEAELSWYRNFCVGIWGSTGGRGAAVQVRGFQSLEREALNSMENHHFQRGRTSTDSVPNPLPLLRKKQSGACSQSSVGSRNKWQNTRGRYCTPSRTSISPWGTVVWLHQHAQLWLLYKTQGTVGRFSGAGGKPSPLQNELNEGPEPIDYRNQSKP